MRTEREIKAMLKKISTRYLPEDSFAAFYCAALKWVLNENKSNSGGDKKAK